MTQINWTVTPSVTLSAASASDWDDNRPAIPRIPQQPKPRLIAVAHDGDSDPDGDELLHRARNPRGGLTVAPDFAAGLSPAGVDALARLQLAHEQVLAVAA